MSNANSYHNIEPCTTSTLRSQFKYVGYDSRGNKYYALKHKRNQDRWHWAQTVPVDGTVPYFCSDTLKQASRMLETINES